MIQAVLTTHTSNRMKEPLWCLLSRLKTGQMTGAIVLEESFNLDTGIKAVHELLYESGMTACPLWNVTKVKHEALFQSVKKIRKATEPNVPTVGLLDQLLCDSD